MGRWLLEVGEVGAGVLNRRIFRVMKPFCMIPYWQTHGNTHL